MTDSPHKRSELAAEVSAFVEALDIKVLEDLCRELQVVQQELESRDQMLLEMALQRLAQVEGQRPVSPSSPQNLSKAFERPA